MSDQISHLHATGSSEYWKERSKAEASAAAKIANEALSAHGSKHSSRLLKLAKEHEERSRRFATLATRIEQTGEIVFPAEDDISKLLSDGKQLSQHLATSAHSTLPKIKRILRSIAWILVWIAVAAGGYWVVNKVYFNRCMKTEMPIAARAMGVDPDATNFNYLSAQSAEHAALWAKRFGGELGTAYGAIAVAWRKCESRSLPSLIWN